MSLKESYDSDDLFFGFVVDGGVPWYGGSTSGIYRIFINSDGDSGTGYSGDQSCCGGADYLVEYVIGFSPRLFRYSGSGTDWSWSFVKREVYLYNPGGLENIVIVVPKDHITGLGDSFYMCGETAKGSGDAGSLKIDDTGGCLPAPVPEPYILSIAALIIVSILVFSKRYMR